RGDQAGLSRDPREARSRASHSRAEAGAGADTDTGMKGKRSDRRPRERKLSRGRHLLLIPGIEILARTGSGRLRHAFGARAAMRTSSAPREALATAIAFISPAAIDLRLRTGDEGGQAVDAAIVRRHRLRLRLRRILRLRAMLALAAVLARLLLFALKGLLVVALMVAPTIVAYVGLRLVLLRHEARLLAEARIALALVLAVLGDHLVGARLRLVLSELLLRRRDQPEIMLGVLIVVLGRDRIARGARITRELQIFLGDVRGRAADLDVGTVRFEHPGH